MISDSGHNSNSNSNNGKSNCDSYQNETRLKCGD